MNFNQGDQVIHQKFGVGIIVSIEEMSFSGNIQHLFYHVDFSSTTVWVPVDGQLKGGVRRLTPRNHLNRYRSLLNSSPDALDMDFHKRKIELHKRIDQGSFQGLCEVVRDLYALDKEKPLNTYDKTFYKRTRDALVLEWSATSGLTQSEATTEIESYLHKRKLSPVNA
jgi:CarD family transcriptional regulator